MKGSTQSPWPSIWPLPVITIVSIKMISDDDDVDDGDDNEHEHEQMMEDTQGGETRMSAPSDGERNKGLIIFFQSNKMNPQKRQLCLNCNGT